jgi:hypothetical protein
MIDFRQTLTDRERSVKSIDREATVKEALKEMSEFVVQNFPHSHQLNLLDRVTMKES